MQRFLFIVATCAMGEYLGKDKSDEVLQEEIVKVIYNNALPLFRRHIESGRVRISFLDYKEVRLRSVNCKTLNLSHSIVHYKKRIPNNKFLMYELTSLFRF